MNQSPKQIATRYRALFGTGWQGKLAACMDVRPNTVTNQVRGHTSLQHWFAAYIEFFEVTPRALWPERWAALREVADKVGALWPTPEQSRALYGDGPDGFQIVGPVENNLYKEFVRGLIMDSNSPLVAKTDRGAK